MAPLPYFPTWRPHVLPRPVGPARVLRPGGRIPGVHARRAGDDAGGGRAHGGSVAAQRNGAALPADAPPAAAGPARVGHRTGGAALQGGGARGDSPCRDSRGGICT